jgi:hypothetical protein
MIAVLLAAVIGQPLDAEFSTAGHPGNYGAAVEIRHPAAWKVTPLASKYGIARITAPSGQQEIRIWITDEFAVLFSEEGSHTPEFRFVNSGQLEKDFLSNKTIVHAETLLLNEKPARICEYISPDGAHEVFVGMLHGSHAILITIGGKHTSAEDFAKFKPFYVEMIKSIQVRGDVKSIPAYAFAFGAIIVALLGFAAFRWWSRHSATRLPALPSRRATRRKKGAS